jgi:hypothetical protein
MGSFDQEIRPSRQVCTADLLCSPGCPQKMGWTQHLEVIANCVHGCIVTQADQLSHNLRSSDRFKRSSGV